MAGWTDYYERHASREPSRLLTRAMAHVAHMADTPAGRVALDLGCGNGHEARWLQQQAWHVHAFDRERAAIERVQAGATAADTPGTLTAHVASFEALRQLPAASLIHAGLSLPFCAPAAFPGFWQVVLAAWQPGGIFAGHFFGPQDAWAADPGMTFHSAEAVRQLFSGGDVLELNEFEGMAPSMGGPKYWHRIEVIARNATARG